MRDQIVHRESSASALIVSLNPLKLELHLEVI